MEYKINIRNKSLLDECYLFVQPPPLAPNEPVFGAWQGISETMPTLREIDYRIDFDVYASTPPPRQSLGARPIGGNVFHDLATAGEQYARVAGTGRSGER